MVTDRFNTRYDRGNVPGTQRHRFLVTGLFPLPVGQGRRFGTDWHGLVDGILGGWELSTVTLLQSGVFQTPTTLAGRDQSNTNAGFRGVPVRPDRTGDGNPPSHSAAAYYDKSAFAYPPAGAGRFGSAGAGILNGPGTFSVSAGLAKTFQLRERAKLRLEGTFANLPNHHNFLPPSANIDFPNFGQLTQWQGRTGQVGARIDF